MQDAYPVAPSNHMRALAVSQQDIWQSYGVISGVTWTTIAGARIPLLIGMVGCPLEDFEHSEYNCRVPKVRRKPVQLWGSL